MTKEELRKRAGEFERKEREKVKDAWRSHEKFLSLYPFRQHPEQIDSLTPEKIYKRGARDCFFSWIYRELKYLGHLRKRQDPKVWENAKKKSRELKQLLRISVDDSLSISQKVDAPWETIKYFGGDKMIAKKIIFCYNPDTVLPIFKTDHLELFSSRLQIDFRKLASSSFEKAYGVLTLGQKFEHLNNLVLQFKNKEAQIEKWDGVLFMRFLYTVFLPKYVQHD